jgi:hypothetical protein
MRSGCALAWNNHWLPFVRCTTSQAVSSDLSHAQNTPWSVRYARLSIIEVTAWLDTLSLEQPSPLATSDDQTTSIVSAEDWSMSCDQNVFIKFACDKVRHRIQQCSDAMVFGSNMQLFAETLDECCDLQKIIFDICGSLAAADRPSALSAFCEDDDMFESWLYVDDAATPNTISINVFDKSQPPEHLLQVHRCCCC